MKKFEYCRRLILDVGDLAAAGLQGWEFCCIDNKGRYIFKRELPSSSPTPTPPSEGEIERIQTPYFQTTDLNINGTCFSAFKSNDDFKKFYGTVTRLVDAVNELKAENARRRAL